MALEAKGSALVAGEALTPDTHERVEVVRGFYWDSLRQAPGTILMLPSRFAREYRMLGKVKAAPEPQPEPAKPIVKLEGALSVAPPSSTTDEKPSEPKRPRRKEGERANVEQ